MLLEEQRCKPCGEKPSSSGFTLIEVIAVLILLGVLAAFAVSRYVGIEASARQSAIEAAMAEFNGREALLWTRYQLLQSDFANVNAFDLQIWRDLNPYLDANMPDYGSGSSHATGKDWNLRPTRMGNATTGREYRAELDFQGEEVTVHRIPATFESPGVWYVP